MNFSDTQLEAYLDEVLPVEQMAAVEEALRHSDALQKRLLAINGRRDAGVHSIGEIWRRNRLSCPPREQLGSFLLGVLPADAADYVRFHLETIECRYCAASIQDLRAQQSAADADQTQKRRHRYFQSSAGYLHKHD
jgi:anti-sigma factor RsiW